MGVLVRGANGVCCELHHAEKFRREKSERGRPRSTSRNKEACLNKSSASHITTESDAGVCDKVGRVGEAESGRIRRHAQSAHRLGQACRGTGKTERATARAGAWSL